MKHFKQFLKEALTKKQENQVAKWSKRTAEATEATDPYFGKGVEDKHEELDEHQDKSETHRAIEKHLGMEIKPEDYKGGHMTDKYNRQVRIGAVLGKTKAPAELARGFENDTTRQGKGFTGLSVRTTRSACGVAGQTSGNQSWADESCKNFANGQHKEHLPSEVEHGTVVSYLHDKTGNELARATFQPHKNDVGNTMYKLNSYYGIKHAGFMAHNMKTESELSGEHKGGSPVYRINPHVYNNDLDGFGTAMHPKASSESINTALSDPSPRARAAALTHPAANTEHINTALNDKEFHVRKAAAMHPKASSDNLMKALGDKDLKIREIAIKNPNTTTEHVDKAMNDSEPSVRMNAVRNPKATEAHITKAINDRDFDVRSAAMENPKATEAHITSILNGEQHTAKQVALHHPNITSEHINTALNDKHPLVRMAAIENTKPEKVTAEHITKALGDTHPGVRKLAMQHPNATREHLERASNDENEVVSKLANIRLRKLDDK